MNLVCMDGSYLFTRLVRSKRDAQDGPDDPPKPDDLVHTAAHNVHWNGKAYSAIGSARGVDGCVDSCTCMRAEHVQESCFTVENWPSGH